MSTTTKQGPTGRWTATDPDHPGIVGHGETEAEALRWFYGDEGIRELALRDTPPAPGAPSAPGAVVLFSAVFDALIASGWAIVATTYPHGHDGAIAALVKKGSKEFTAMAARGQIVDADWLAPIIEQTGLDPSTIG